MRTPGGKAYWILFSNGVVTQFGEAPGSGASPPVRPDRSVPPQRSSRQPRARASGLGPPTVPTTTSETHHMTEACSGCALTHRSSLGSAGRQLSSRGDLPRYAKSSSLRDSPEALRAINVAISSAAPSRGTAGVLVTGRQNTSPFPSWSVGLKFDIPRTDGYGAGLLHRFRLMAVSGRARPEVFTRQ